MCGLVERIVLLSTMFESNLLGYVAGAKCVDDRDASYKLWKSLRVQNFLKVNRGYVLSWREAECNL